METALVLPLLLVMALAIVALGRVTQTQMAVSAVAREAARTGALANQASLAQRDGESRGFDVAVGYHLSPPRLQVHVDPSQFRRCGSVLARATYDLDFSDLPLLGWAHLTLGSSHSEPIDGYRSQLSGQC